MEIQLTGKKEGKVIVSPEDYELLSQYIWNQDKNGYVSGRINGKNYPIHRFIMDAKKGQKIDHINGNTLDNRRENLRLATISQNNQNLHRDKTDGTYTSKFRGVYYSKNDKRYSSKIKHNYKQYWLGYFDNEIDAAEAFDMYVVHNKLDFYGLNYPDKKEDYLAREYKPREKHIKAVKYYGITQQKGKYIARFDHNNKNIYLLTSKDPIECAKKYDEYIVKNNIINKTLNFPKDYPDYQPVNIIRTFCENIDDMTVKLLISKDNSRCVKIDKEDYDKIKYYKCSFNYDKYVYITINGKMISLHRFLMNQTDQDIFVDHINSDIYDNTKKNLRISNIAKNAQNRIKLQNTTSKYMGVSYAKDRNKWSCCLIKDGKKLLNSSYKIEEDAARTRDLYILLKLPNEHYKLNFTWTPEEINMWKNKLNFE